MLKSRRISREQIKFLLRVLRMTSIERLTSKEHHRTDPEIKTSACAANDRNKENK